MPTIEETLKSLGASDEDLKALTGNTKMKAALEAKFAETQTAIEGRAAAESKLNEYNDWYQNQALPAVTATQTKLNQATADLAAERARIKALQDAGLFQQAIDSGADPKTLEAAPVVAPGPDMSKYVTEDTLYKVADREGEAIAVAAELLQDHRELFGNQRLPLKELREEAKRLKIPVTQLWEQKYKVTEKRAELAKKADDDRTAAIRKEEREKVMSELENPMTRPPSASSFPTFSKKEGADAATAQPWNKSGAENDRVAKAMKSLNGQSQA